MRTHFLRFSFLCLLLTGCQSVPMTGTKADAAFLSEPSRNKTPPATGNVFPSKVGDSWLFRSIDSKRNKQYSERLFISGERTRAGKKEQSFTWERGGKAYAQSVYQMNEDSLTQVAVGQKGEVLVRPALTILKFPASEGSVQTWQGELVFGKITQSGEASVRVTRLESVKVPAGKFDAYRVDTVLQILSQGGQRPIRSSAWYAPKVGMVKQQLEEGDSVLLRELTAYRLKP